MRKIISLIVLALLLIQCANEEDNRIAKNKVGEITNNTIISDLDVIFEKDSILKLPVDSEEYQEFKIFNKEGKHTLTLMPKYGDSLNTFERVLIYDNKYITEKGISTDSKFIDIVNSYTINKIEPTFSSAMLLIDEINMTIALDKKDLKLDEFDMRKISQEQIPDLTKVKFITVWFE